MGKIIPGYLSLSEAEEALRREVSRFWLLQRIRAGQVPARKIGSRWFVPEEALESLKQQIRKREKAQKIPEGYVSVQEVLSRTRLHRNTVYRWLKQGKIPARKMNGKWFIPVEVFWEILEG